MFDLSHYPKDSNFFDHVNERVIVKMKEVPERKINEEFGGLSSKMYSLKNIDVKEFNTAKGVHIGTETNQYKDILFNTKIIRHKMRRIQEELNSHGSS